MNDQPLEDNLRRVLSYSGQAKPPEDIGPVTKWLRGHVRWSGVEGGSV